jgi:hypothetical protein
MDCILSPTPGGDLKFKQKKIPNIFTNFLTFYFAFLSTKTYLLDGHSAVADFAAARSEWGFGLFEIFVSVSRL